MYSKSDCFYSVATFLRGLANAVEVEAARGLWPEKGTSTFHLQASVAVEDWPPTVSVLREAADLIDSAASSARDSVHSEQNDGVDK